ncbi:hypothetical protein JT359_09130 [Candidatus Poribacteria bacterium]|nr:hypothetical protein [Candidatus Poribacteria bacterium]
MRNLLVLCIFLLIGMVVFADISVAANRIVFKPPLTEKQMLEWLKEKNYDAETLPDGRYRIYYLEPDPKGKIIKNGSHFTVFTFDWGPRGDIANVMISSSVELVKMSSTSSTNKLPTFRYRYHIKSLKTSQQPVSSLRVNTPDLPRSWHRNILNPPEWHNMGQSHKKRGYNGIAWLHSGKTGSYGLPPGTSQDGFALQCQSVPGITVAHVWTTGRDMNGVDGVNTLHDPQTAPRGPVVGPVSIPSKTSPLELTHRLETLTIQSIELGWLDEIAAVPLQQHIANIRTAFEKNAGLQSQAKRTIQEFIAVLNALEKQSKLNFKQTGTMLSPSGSPSAEIQIQMGLEPPIIEEAITLLKTNAEYLLTRF